MKKAYLLLGAAGMLLASCSQDALEGPAVNGNGNTTITVQLPKSMGSRAVFGDGSTATQLNVAVFDNVGNSYTFLYGIEDEFDGDKAVINLELVPSQTYTVAFFASAPNNNVYTWDENNATVTVNYGAMTSEGNLGDLYDCFSGSKEITGGSTNNFVTLTRPVAQICWGTTPLTAGSDQATIIQNAFGAQWQYLLTNFTASNINNQLKVLSGETSIVAGDNNFDGSVSLDGFAAPYNQPFPAVGNGPAVAYTWIASQYVLVPQTSGTTNLVLTINNKGVVEGEEGEEPMSHPTASVSYTLPVNSAPIQANYRTLIYGNLFTSNTSLTVTKDAIWSTPANGGLLINANNVNLLNNGTGNYILSEDVNYNAGQLQFLYDIDINLNGNSMTSVGGKYGDAIVIQGTTKGTNVTLSNGTITSSSSASKANLSTTIYLQGNNYPSHLTLNDINIEDATVYPILLASQNPGSTITINSGTYYSAFDDGPAVRVGASLSATQGGKVTINGGTFGKPGVTNNFLLNVLDNLSKDKDPRQYIEVFGGTFINFNPAANAAEGDPTNFVAEGYEVMSEQIGDDMYYTVVPSANTDASGN